MLVLIYSTKNVNFWDKYNFKVGIFVYFNLFLVFLHQ